MPGLTALEAGLRGRLLSVRSYAVELDLDRGPEFFGSRSRIVFDAGQGDGSTFLDVRAHEVHGAWLNGVALDPASIVDGRLPLTGLRGPAGEAAGDAGAEVGRNVVGADVVGADVVGADVVEGNVVEVEATMRYRHDGEGLHRALDPADGAAYVYAMTFLDAAPTVYACFDQPDLKAPYEVSVRVPHDWSVVGNGAATRDEHGVWHLARTAPLATYFVTVCAGPWASVTAVHRGITLAWHARASLRAELEAQAPELLAVTRDGLDYFERLFGIDYPFGDSYDQVLVPEFNAGAMENPGCVTYAETALHRGAATLAQRRERATTILHEMAHMWFGDLVTMRWWDDLWLNESFAEYMAHRAVDAIGEFPGAWVDFGMTRKAWGYAAERRPSTHPVAANPAADASSALQNFDGISYAKGASVLRQLIAYVTDGAFLAGVRHHLREHAGANADLGDFLAAVGEAAGGDLGAWADAWLRTAGRDELAVDASTRYDEVDGAQMTDVVLWRTPPIEESGDGAADRPHALDIAGYTGGEQLWRVEVRAECDETPLPALRGRRAPALLLPNASDLTWADVRLDAATTAALPVELPPLRDSRARVVAWVALIDAVVQGATPPQLYLDTLRAALPSEQDSGVVAMLGRTAASIATSYLPAPQEGWAQIAAAAADLLARLDTQADGATGGPGAAGADDASLRLAALRLQAGASDDVALLREWLAGRGAAAGLGQDRDFGWLCLTSLARLGAAGDADIDARLARDTSLDGRLHALAARAAIPTAAAKAAAWDVLAGGAAAGEGAGEGASNYERIHSARGFWRTSDPQLVAPYVARYCQELPGLQTALGEAALGRLASAAFPAAIATADTAALVTARLGEAGLVPAVRRAFVDGLADLSYALVSRRRYYSGD